MSTFSKDFRQVLVLQGGGALGSYQAGAFEKMASEGYEPDYVAGISIGAINAAIIAGNRPEDRVARLRIFWERVTRGELFGNGWIGAFEPFMERGQINQLRAVQAMFAGVAGFYALRPRHPLLSPAGTPEALSFYDTAPLRETLLELVDFDYLNERHVRLAVGAVNIETGNQEYFDNAHMVIRPEHIMASGALPPGFPPVEIDGQYFWDGGIVSNAPLQYVLDNHDPGANMAIFQFDLFSARGHIPRTLADIEAREKDIRFSSRTRYSSDQIAHLQKLRAAMLKLYNQLPKALQDSPEARFLMEARHEGRILLIQMIYRSKIHEHGSKDYEFSRHSMLDHWAAGSGDVGKTMKHAGWIEAQSAEHPMLVLDFSNGRRSAEAGTQRV